MRQYRYITAGEIYQEIMIRLGTEYRSREDIGFHAVISLINDAVREVFLKTLPYKDWAYVSRIDVFDGKALPTNFVKPIRVLLSSDGLANGAAEARFASAKEFYSVTDTRAAIYWNQQTQANPVYTMWGQLEVAGTVANSRTTVYVYPQAYKGWMDCYIVPDRADQMADKLYVPYEFEDMAILSALAKVYTMLGDNDKFMEAHSEVNNKVLALQTMKQEKEQTEILEQGIFAMDENGVPMQQGQLRARGIG